MKVKIDKKQRLYTIPEAGGYSSLGFDVCAERARKLAEEMGLPEALFQVGSMEMYNWYRDLVEAARQKNKAIGWRSKSDLHPQLIGLEGRRVEVEDADGEVYRFKVGKSTGWIPVHLQLHNERSSDGPVVDSRPFRRVTIIR
ncbi:MAG: hypothetical protein M0R74_11720 [Dehalococcoidia bacterium]|jgi:hypothetical protein|nr:hypothetical protein [Dehalococcoidia bacterium]